MTISKNFISVRKFGLKVGTAGWGAMYTAFSETHDHHIGVGASIGA